VYIVPGLNSTELFCAANHALTVPARTLCQGPVHSCTPQPHLLPHGRQPSHHTRLTTVTRDGKFNLRAEAVHVPFLESNARAVYDESFRSQRSPGADKALASMTIIGPGLTLVGGEFNTSLLAVAFHSTSPPDCTGLRGTAGPLGVPVLYIHTRGYSHGEMTIFNSLKKLSYDLLEGVYDPWLQVGAQILMLTPSCVL
jgi:hypothetical protein